MATKAPVTGSEISIMEVVEGQMEFCILGTSPFICNRMSQKAWFELLAPQKKTAADKAANMKHDPMAEFRNSPYRMASPDAATVLAVFLVPVFFVVIRKIFKGSERQRQKYAHDDVAAPVVEVKHV